MRVVSCSCVLLVGAASCILSASAKREINAVPQADVLTVFLTGNELGALKPCGCSGGQLGGLERRPAVLDGVPPATRLIVDTGSFVQNYGTQDGIKLDILVEAFSLLGYDVVNLTEQDLEMLKDLGPPETISPTVNLITSQKLPDVNVPATFSKQFSLKNQTVAVTVAAFDPNSGPIEQIEQLFEYKSDVQTVNILLLNSCNADVVASIAQLQLVDCLVCPSESDEPKIIGEPSGTALVVSVGRYGKYVAKLQIKPGRNGDEWNLSFEAVAITEDLPRHKALVDLYKAYQQLVKEADLIEKHPRFGLPNGLHYVGTESCKSCHGDEYRRWKTTAHANAYATLEKVSSQYDPECIICHVVGFEYESGFFSEQKTGHLKNVGCENCHGPGSKHVESLGSQRIGGPKFDCLECHNPEHSGEFVGQEQLYLEKIAHWWEPNAPGNVK